MRKFYIVYIILIFFCKLSVLYSSEKILISEIYYNPCAEQGSDLDYEFLELYNNSDEDIDISSYYFRDGISFVFPEGTIFKARTYIVLNNQSNVYMDQGFNTFKWDKDTTLSNAGELITFYDRSNTLLTSVTYDDRGDWPESADGGCLSIELINRNLSHEKYSNWKASSEKFGTPGRVNSNLLVLSELSFDSEGPDFIEFRNIGEDIIDLYHWKIKNKNGDVLKVIDEHIIVFPFYFVVFWFGGDSNFLEKEYFVPTKFEREKSGFMIEDDLTNIVGSFEYNEITEDLSYLFENDDINISLLKTPGKENQYKEVIKGCNDSMALNYNEKSNFDDGSCEYESFLQNLIISDIIIDAYCFENSSSVESFPDSQEYRFIEIYNNSNDSIDLSRFSITGDLVFNFPENFILETKKIIIITHDKKAFENLDIDVFEWISFNTETTDFSFNMIDSKGDIFEKIRYYQRYQLSSSDEERCKEFDLTRSRYLGN